MGVYTVDTGSGYWNPIILLVVLLIAFLVIYIIRSLGRRGYKPVGDKTKPFLSGNKESPGYHVKPGSLYWGFVSSMDTIYRVSRRLHTGDISDYVLWFVIVLALSFVIVIGVVR